MRDLHSSSWGEGEPVLAIHGTGTSSRYFEAAGDALGRLGQVTAPDRPGWGLSPAPEDYRRTSVAEQATAVASFLSSGDEPSVILGEGLGGVVGLEIALSMPGRVRAVAMIDPPVFGLLTDATPGVSADAERIREAVEQGGPPAAYELFLTGRLATLGAGAGRLGDLADQGPRAPWTFLVEIPAIPAWSLEPERFRRLRAPVLLVSVADSPPLLRRAADSLVERIPNATRHELTEVGPAAAAGALSLVGLRND